MKSDSSFEKSLTCKQISSSYFELSVLAIFLAYYLYQISISDFILFLSEPHPLFSNYTVIVFNFILIWPQSCIVICWAQGYNFRRTTVQRKESGCSTLKYQLYEILWKKGHWVLTLNFCACPAHYVLLHFRWQFLCKLESLVPIIDHFWGMCA